MANKHIELCLRSLRKCKLKHNDISLHAYSMDKARNNTDNIKWCQRCGAIGSFIHCWWEFQVAQPLWKILLQFLLILNMQLSYNLTCEFVGIYPRKRKTYDHTKTCTCMFVDALFLTTPNWKKPRCPPGSEWLNK